MEFSELLVKRRSIREFEEREVPLDVVREIINDSVKAPSGGHAQPWSFIVVQNRKMIKRISDDSTRSMLATMEQDSASQMLNMEDINVFFNAPCLVIIAGPIDWPTIVEDCALAAAYFMFAATARGLGTCWVAMGAYVSDPNLLDELGLTKGQKIYAPIILGYPMEIPPMPERKAPEIIKVIS
jgi:nitroreductase